MPRLRIGYATASNNQYVGVYYFPPSGSTATTGIVIDRVSANNDAIGIAIVNNPSGAATGSISNSIASFNTSEGFYFFAATVSLDASNATSNSIYGVELGSGTLALGRSVIMNNSGYGLYVDAGTVNSYKDNRIAGNGFGQVSVTPTAATLY